MSLPALYSSSGTPGRPTGLTTAGVPPYSYPIALSLFPAPLATQRAPRVDDVFLAPQSSRAQRPPLLAPYWMAAQAPQSVCEAARADSASGRLSLAGGVRTWCLAPLLGAHLSFALAALPLKDADADDEDAGADADDDDYDDAVTVPDSCSDAEPVKTVPDSCSDAEPVKKVAVAVPVAVSTSTSTSTLTVATATAAPTTIPWVRQTNSEQGVPMSGAIAAQLRAAAAAAQPCFSFGRCFTLATVRSATAPHPSTVGVVLPVGMPILVWQGPRPWELALTRVRALATATATNTATTPSAFAGDHDALAHYDNLAQSDAITRAVIFRYTDALAAGWVVDAGAGAGAGAGVVGAANAGDAPAPASSPRPLLLEQHTSDVHNFLLRPQLLTAVSFAAALGATVGSNIAVAARAAQRALRALPPPDRIVPPLLSPQAGRMTLTVGLRMPAVTWLVQLPPPTQTPHGLATAVASLIIAPVHPPPRPPPPPAYTPAPWSPPPPSAHNNRHSDGGELFSSAGVSVAQQTVEQHSGPLSPFFSHANTPRHAAHSTAAASVSSPSHTLQRLSSLPSLPSSPPAAPPPPPTTTTSRASPQLPLTSSPPAATLTAPHSDNDTAGLLMMTPLPLPLPQVSVVAVVHAASIPASASASAATPKITTSAVSSSGGWSIVAADAAAMAAAIAAAGIVAAVATATDSNAAQAHAAPPVPVYESSSRDRKRHRDSATQEMQMWDVLPPSPSIECSLPQVEEESDDGRGSGDGDKEGQDEDRGKSTLDLLPPPPPRHKRLLENDDDDNVNDDADGGGTSSGILYWIQCSYCEKWRRVPEEVEKDAKLIRWVCTDNAVFDPIRGDCGAAEESWGDLGTEALADGDGDSIEIEEVGGAGVGAGAIIRRFERSENESTLRVRTGFAASSEVVSDRKWTTTTRIIEGGLGGATTTLIERPATRSRDVKVVAPTPGKRLRRGA